MSFPPWFRERLPALSATDAAPELVLLHGWGATAEVWRAWLPLLRQRCHVTLLDLPGFGRSAFQPGLGVDELLDQLKTLTPANAVWVGWSLGGALAIAMTGRYPDHCAGLMTIATNPCFVARPDWPHGMEPALFAEFATEAASNPAALYRRFLALQARGGDDERTLLRWLRQTATALSPEAAAWGLQLLNALDVRQALSRWQGPGMHLLGGSDALVPSTVAGALGAALPNHWVMRLEGISHVPFLSEPELVYQNLIRVVAQTGQLPRWRPPRRDKLTVARAFSRAATSYDSVADLQRRVADGLRVRLRAADAWPATGEQWLDLGCGTGAETVALLSESSADAVAQPAALETAAAVAESPVLIGLDLAEGMVAHARERWPRSQIHWLCGDAESLPVAGASLDGVFSSLAVQWAEHVEALFAELYRVLKPGASAWLATLGPATLAELSAAWREVDDRVHVNDFAPRSTLQQAIDQVGLGLVQWDEEIVVQRYGELTRLTRELRHLGAGNVNSGRPAGLGGRDRIRRLRAAYDQFRDESGLLPATWQVWYLRVQRPCS